MFGKVIAGSSFGATVGYVMKEQSHVLAAEGVTPPNVRDIARDFKDQALLNPRLKNTVGHISLSFSPKDADKLTDAKMTCIAKEYMERMGIRDTQFLLVRHLDQAHPHCHLIYNRVGNNGQTISDKNIKIRNGKVCKELTAKHGLYYAPGKDEVRRERLREPDKTRYEIYDTIKGCLPGCKSWSGLEKQLQERGITTSYKYCGQTDRKQGILFGKNGFTFSGSKIDRAFSYANLDRHFGQVQQARPTATHGRYSAQSVNNLSASAEHYRSVFAELFGSRGDSGESADMGAFGQDGHLPLALPDSPGRIDPDCLERRIGESPEEHIARVTALIQAATAAMLAVQEERAAKIRQRKSIKHKLH